MVINICLEELLKVTRPVHTTETAVFIYSIIYDLDFPTAWFKSLRSELLADFCKEKNDEHV